MLIKYFSSPSKFLEEYNLLQVFPPEVVDAVAKIVADVRQNGDRALLAYTEKLDGVRRKSVVATQEDVNEKNKVDELKLSLFRKAYQNIKKFHEAEFKLIRAWESSLNTAFLGQYPVPVERVGVYVPGGSTCYPSSVLMNIVPAMVAGVKEIALVSPPDSKTGKLNRYVAAIADMLKISEIYVVGGAQAIAALAFGTESIKPVDKITGPGNCYVAEAKRQVFGYVGIDSVAGPSEVVIIADDSCQPDLVAIDMLAQAEHDVNSRAICISASKEVLKNVEIFLEKLLQTEEKRKKIAEESLQKNGALVKVDSAEEAVKLANYIAPEHLELHVENPRVLLPKITNAGAVFLGRTTPEAVGDYWAGCNHILPTSRSARFSSGLSVRDFIKWVNYAFYDQEKLADEGAEIVSFARLEGLNFHAKSVEMRLKNQEKSL
ncbi:MAG: histidinol dehydrogenase [Candidatus Neomarinimicrobiota bacterium]|nr:MAG: histidinol dehydrogenase [Candidatus Neomarinimicrobiota bacterium]